MLNNPSAVLPLTVHLFPNMSTRVALRVASGLGCTILPRRGTDELVVRHHWRPTRPLTIKGTRKDAPRALLSFIRSLHRLHPVLSKAGNN
jgi:hypothetical protein